MQQELDRAGGIGYEVVDVAVGGTVVGGDEVIVITRRVDD